VQRMPLSRSCPTCAGTGSLDGRDCRRCDDGRQRLTRIDTGRFLGWADTLLAAAGTPMAQRRLHDATQRWIDSGVANPGRFEGWTTDDGASEPQLVRAFGPLGRGA